MMTATPRRQMAAQMMSYRSGEKPSKMMPQARLREVEVLLEVADGLSNKEVGRMLHISEATMKTHLLHIFAKLGVEDRTGAVTTALERGIIRINSPRGTS